VLYAFNVWGLGGWQYGSATISDPQVYAMGTTAVLIGIMAGQLGNIISTRVGLHSALKSNPFSNRWIPIGIIVEMALLSLMVYAPFLQTIFGTAALAPTDWLALFLLAPAILLIDEIRKYFVRRISKTYT
jgi:magnesium-transporting ATPase (P-type)